MLDWYRVWIKEEKRMACDVIDINYQLNTVLWHDLKDGTCKESDIDDVDFMKCTGLKDKNGKEIFEGDIVKMYDYIYEIKKDYDNCRFCMNGIDNPNCGKDSLILASFKLEHIEIIGNIYENPELLDKEPEKDTFNEKLYLAVQNWAKEHGYSRNFYCVDEGDTQWTSYICKKYTYKDITYPVWIIVDYLGNVSLDATKIPAPELNKIVKQTELDTKSLKKIIDENPELLERK